MNDNSTNDDDAAAEESTSPNGPPYTPTEADVVLPHSLGQRLQRRRQQWLDNSKWGLLPPDATESLLWHSHIANVRFHLATINSRQSHDQVVHQRRGLGPSHNNNSNNSTMMRDDRGRLIIRRVASHQRQLVQALRDGVYQRGGRFLQQPRDVSDCGPQQHSYQELDPQTSLSLCQLAFNYYSRMNQNQRRHNHSRTNRRDEQYLFEEQQPHNVQQRLVLTLLFYNVQRDACALLAMRK